MKKSAHYFYVKIYVYAAIAAGILLANVGAAEFAYAQAPGQSAQTQQKLPTVIAPTDKSAKETLTDKSFVEKSASNILKDSEISKLALAKSDNKKIKDFAKKIVGESSPAWDKLKKAAATRDIDVPQQISADEKTMIDQMKTLKGQDFDQAYVSVMKKSLDINVGLYDNAAGQKTLKPELRDYANAELPQLRENQEQAHALIGTAPVPSEAYTK